MNKLTKMYYKKARRNRRIQKCKDKDKVYMDKALENGYDKISLGRKMINGSFMRCEMRYIDCEVRGYCNGDC